MAIAAPPRKPGRKAAARGITWEQYLAEPTTMQRYDIVDGKRIPMSPSRRHQRIVQNVLLALSAFERASRMGQAIVAPSDIMIRRHPLRTRQPDLYFITLQSLADTDENTGVLTVAPELVVEVLSPNETRRKRDGKIADYRTIGVRECWVLSPEAETVEVLRLSEAGVEAVGVYANSQTASSELFPDLTVPVGDLFAD